MIHNHIMKQKPTGSVFTHMLAHLHTQYYMIYNIYNIFYKKYVTKCIVCVLGHEPLIFSFLSLLFFDWVGVLWPQLSKVLKLVRWAHRGFQARSKDLEILEEGGGAGPSQLCPEEIMSREVVLG